MTVSRQPPGESAIPPSLEERADNRHAKRRRVLKSGTIAFNNRHITLPCVIREMSDQGARLRVGDPVSPPDRFKLIAELDAVEADCEVIWRSGSDLGVKFSEPPRKVAPKRVQVVASSSIRPSLRRKPVE